MKAMQYGIFTTRWKVQWWWASKPRVRMQWFLESLEELGIECRVGHPAKIRAAETRKQKRDRRDAQLILDLLLMKDRFPDLWMPSTEQRDLRTLLRDRHQWVKMRTRLQHTLQAIALNHALRQGHALWCTSRQTFSFCTRMLLVLYNEKLVPLASTEADKRVDHPGSEHESH